MINNSITNTRFTAYLKYDFTTGSSGPNKPHKALENFKKSIKLDPANVYVHTNLVFTLEDLNRSDEAVEYLRRTISESPMSAPELIHKGYYFYTQNNYDDSLYAFQKAAESDPHNITAHMNLGIIYLNLRRFEEALSSFNRAGNILPGYYAVLHNKGKALFEMNRVNEAKLLFQEALDSTPTDHVSCFFLGLIHARSSSHKEALKYYTRALKLNRLNWEHHYYMAETLMALKRKGTGIKAYQKALKLYPEHYEISSHQIKALIMSKKQDVALLILDDAIDADHDNINLYYYKAWVYSSINNVSEALVWLERYLNNPYYFHRKAIEEDEFFKNLNKDMRFIKLLLKYCVS